MSIRSKSIGIVSAAALSLSMASGIAFAADSSTSADLDPLTDPFGCTIAVTAGTSIDFGTFTWDGSAYNGTPTPGSVTLELDTDLTPGERDCGPVNVKGTDLTLTGVSAFPVGAISVGVVSPLSATDQELIPANADVALGGVSSTHAVTLDGSMVNNSAPAGTYEGTITFTVAAGV